MSTASMSKDEAIKVLNEAGQSGKITRSAIQNIETWLSEARYDSYVSEIIEHIHLKKWRELDDAFWMVIPFGTGGRRGRMYPIGCNVINERTIGESAQGLADYVKEIKPNGPWSFAVAYDTRHRSREFAELCASIMAANGFTVYFIDDYRSTPELSFLIRFKKCDCGIMVTASHNPPSDNAVKVYWSTGGQLVPPHDKRVIEKVSEVDSIPTVDFESAHRKGQIIFCKEETDAALMKAHLKQSFAGPRDLKVIYSPLHGVGEFNVNSLLQAVGFREVEIYQRHREPSGDFPNVPGNVSNPENSAVFDEIIEHAQSNNSELILATDPDCDRMGAAAPLTLDTAGKWGTFNGNQLAVLLADFILAQHQKNDSLDHDKYIVTTLVTTQMVDRIARSYSVDCHSNLLVGFKWIVDYIDQRGPENFLYGTEESHGYLVGTYARDKDGAVACMLMSELAAWAKSQKMSVHQYLDRLYLKHGFHLERLMTIYMEGSDGMKRMQKLMEMLRNEPPTKLGDLKIRQRRDYRSGLVTAADGTTTDLDGPTDNLVFFDTEVTGNYVGVRPSGTEPKVKFYMFTYAPPDEFDELGTVQDQMNRRLDAFEKSLRNFANTI
jgi:phosphomannomutase